MRVPTAMQMGCSRCPYEIHMHVPTLLYTMITGGNRANGVDAMARIGIMIMMMMGAAQPLPEPEAVWRQDAAARTFTNACRNCWRSKGPKTSARCTYVVQEANQREDRMLTEMQEPKLH
jgi:hypothetical protein